MTSVRQHAASPTVSEMVEEFRPHARRAEQECGDPAHLPRRRAPVRQFAVALLDEPAEEHLQPAIARLGRGRAAGVCAGSSVAARRDTAIVRLFFDSGCRLGGMAGLRIHDLDFEAGVAYVLGKGRRPRAAPFGGKTALALRRYLRARHGHAHAASPVLWLGHVGPFGDAGIKQMLERRGAQAGIEGLHAHQFRHTFAHGWMAAGGNDGDLMRVAGWADRSMLDRYGRAR